jgi:RNase P/RNase MRP subunit p30
MKPETTYQLRNGYQMRYLAELLGTPFNKTKDSVFEKQLTILIENTMKLHTSYLTEGIRGA